MALTKRDKLENLIRQAYAYSGFTQSWLINNQSENTIEYLESDLKVFIEKHSELINELI